MRRAALLLAAVALAAVALSPVPAAAASDPTTSGLRFDVEVPVDVAGPGATADSIASLERAGASLADGTLNGCFRLAPRFVPADGPEAHRLTVLSQRPGQYVRLTRSGSDDPYRGERTIEIGAEMLRGNLALPITGLFLTAGPPPVGGRALIRRRALVEAAALMDRSPICRYTGTVDIEVEYRPYDLVITQAHTFTIRVPVAGAIRGTVEPSTRSAAVSESEVGSCSGSGFQAVGLTVLGEGSGSLLRLEFSPTGREDPITVGCSGGTITFSGDYVRPVLRNGLAVGVPARSGGQATGGRNVEGRRGTIAVTIRRV